MKTMEVTNKALMDLTTIYGEVRDAFLKQASHPGNTHEKIRKDAAYLRYVTYRDFDPRSTTQCDRVFWSPAIGKEMIWKAEGLALGTSNEKEIECFLKLNIGSR